MSFFEPSGVSSAEQQPVSGKQEQFMLLYKPVHERLNRFVHSMVWHREDARDIVADTVLKAYENFEKLENQDSFLYFLFGIASNFAKRRSRRIKFWAPLDNQFAENIVDNGADASRSMESKMEIDSLYKAMKKLPEKQREAVSLFDISGFSLAEVQKIQGGSLSGVKSRIARGREELTRLLTKENIIHRHIQFKPTFEKAVAS